MNAKNISSDPWRSLRADVVRQAGRYTAGGCLALFLFNRAFRPVATLRLCQAAWAAQAARRPLGLLLPLLKLMHRIATAQAGIDLPWRTRVGAGLSLTHGWGMVINQDAVIGRNVTLFHGVTLGRRDLLTAQGRQQGGCPVIEDEVWLGPHAIVVGAVTIGRGSRIAGGAFVTQNVAPHSIVGGNPAVLLRSDCEPDVMNRASA